MAAKSPTKFEKAQKSKIIMLAWHMAVILVTWTN